MQLVRYSERPRLWENIRELLAEVWPEYRWHGEVLSRYWAQLYDMFPGWQFALRHRRLAVVAKGHRIPITWDGTTAGPGRLDATITPASTCDGLRNNRAWWQAPSRAFPAGHPKPAQIS